MCKKSFVIWLSAGLVLLAACTPTGTSTPVTPEATNPPPTPTQPVDPAAACPVPGEGQAQYVSRENGYCFLYPASFSVQPDFLRPAQGVELNGPVVTRGMDGIALHLSVFANGPAEDLDSQSYAGKWLTAYRMDPSLPVQALSLNGQAAALIDNLPGGLFNQRVAFIVANGFKYQVTLSPRPEDEPDLAEAAGQAWELMTQTLTLFPPAAPLPLARPDEICPQPSADTKLWVDEAQGFCLLYPADFELSLDMPGQIIGGPVLMDISDWGKVRTSLTLAGYDQPPAEPGQIPTPPTEQLDPASAQTTTIGGAPAVIYDFTGGPWRQRTADILANGSRYTMVGPWDAQQFPQAVADAQRLWDTVTGSIVFFEKWR